MRQLETLSRVLDDITSTISGILMSVLTILTLGGVFFRYVLGNPVAWIYEVTIVSFSWMIFLGMAMAFKNNEHISILFVVDNLSPRVKYYWKQIVNVLVLIFLVIACYQGVRVTMGTMGQSYNTIPVPRGIFYLAFPIGAVPSFVHVLLRILVLRKEHLTQGGK